MLRLSEGSATLCCFALALCSRYYGARSAFTGFVCGQKEIANRRRKFPLTPAKRIAVAEIVFVRARLS
jgi:hypothetical protein